MSNSFNNKFWAGKYFVISSLIIITSLGFIIPMLLPGESGGMVSMVVIMLLVYLTTRLHGNGLSEIGLSLPKNWISTLGYGLMYMIIIFLAFRITLEPVLEILTGEDRDLSRFNFLIGDLGAVGQTLIMIWITAAFFEEFFFRGYMITYIAKLFDSTNLGWIIGTILSSILFGYVHSYQGISGIILTGLAAVFFAYVFYRHKDNLWIPIIAHGLTDTSGVLFFYFDIYEDVTRFLF